MRVRLTFPHRVREVENEWIPMSDGTRLATRYWLPEGALDNPVPAILEYIPYRKRDQTAGRDETMHPYFAGHGYCAIRVDMRGSGDSEGILHDEYLKQEQDDGLEVIAWIAAQPWCTGKVGMIGKSWGGFNGLQVAARRPPALRCIITVYSVVDRYTEDIHYKGGCLLTHNLYWAFQMFGHNARPPDPDVVGEKWREMWLERLEANQPWVIDWLRHQRRDAYWKHGSVCEDYAAIECPVYAVGGWADIYPSTVASVVEHLKAPRKGLVGPWGHNYAHQAEPGPQIGFLQECLRWWDHWLKGADTGIMDEPAYRVWMQHSVPPRTRHRERPGEWIAEEVWPSPRIERRELALNADGIGAEGGPETPLTVRCPQSVGIASPVWYNHGDMDAAAEDPADQRIDDARSISFDGTPLEQPTAVLGAPEVVLDLAVDRPKAFVCVRLCDVAPDGSSTRVAFGLHNLTHDATHETVTPVTPGERRRVTVRLHEVAHKFAAGHRIRIAVSTSFWPNVWPSPEPISLMLHAGASRLFLPIRPDRREDADLPAFPEPEGSAPLAATAIRPVSPKTTTITHDHATGRVTVTNEKDFGRKRIDRFGWKFGRRWRERRSIVDDDPLTATAEFEAEMVYFRAGQLDLRVEMSCTVTADAEHFAVEAHQQAYESGHPVFARSWLEKIPRDGI
ncbi:CocE/NonD family hydrolase [Chelativorans xinjiangense]|uniref:CocE/NonD family hydrolase n=1 Tax=Chelativorans xinjiangense TaxID=2681485 RepID=UPI001359F388|nr:CocE/NonD family hydrolase [Chelativorans xinjiangense]